MKYISLNTLLRAVPDKAINHILDNSGDVGVILTQLVTTYAALPGSPASTRVTGENFNVLHMDFCSQFVNDDGSVNRDTIAKRRQVLDRPMPASSRDSEAQSASSATQEGAPEVGNSKNERTTMSAGEVKVGDTVEVDRPPWRDASRRHYAGHQFHGKRGVVEEVSPSHTFQNDHHISVKIGEKRIRLWESDVKIINRKESSEQKV